jgi:dihydroorotate dehydrogenase electron transfer subunit
MCNKELTEKPVVLDVSKVIDEGKGLTSIFFDYKLDSKPGQFIMLWLPGVGLKPFSIAYQDETSFGLSIFEYGCFSRSIQNTKVGDKLGIQGPYGTNYSGNGENIALVGGGCGTASLALIADEMVKKGKKVHFIIGARNKQTLLYLNRYDKSNVNMIFCTDDGSHGFHGYTTQALNNLIEKEKIDMIYTCGPEIMMKKVMEISDENNIDCELSMERYMKCGFGVCGQCVVDYKGMRMCKEGPVINKEIVKKIPDFAKYKRDASGKKIYY